MPWLPEVQALEVGMMRPCAPKKMPMFAAVVCGIMRTYELALRPLVSLLMTIAAKSLMSGVLPVEDPHAMPVSPPAITGLPARPASSIASSAARTASGETRVHVREAVPLVHAANGVPAGAQPAHDFRPAGPQRA